MDDAQKELFALGMAHIAVQELYHHHDVIIDAMRDTPRGSAEGLLYAPIPDTLLHPHLLSMRDEARKNGIEIEYELLQIVGTVPPHFHARSGGAIVACDDVDHRPQMLVDYAGMRKYFTWQKVKKGTPLLLPRGTVHGIRYRGDWKPTPFHVLSVNSPAIKPEDIVYV